VTAARHRHSIVALLDEDPDLGAGLTPEEFEAARPRAVAAVIDIDPPTWDVSSLRERSDPSWLGLMMLDGLVLRRVQVGRRAACELFGPGDLLRPWDTDGEYDPLPITVSWLVLKPTRMAVLDNNFVLRTARWPVINSRLVGRVAQRARYLALTQAVTHLPQAHARLLLLFWLLAERWGNVGPEGVHVRLPVTHEVLAMLVGAQRPTVTLALQRLSRARLVIRERPDRWLLTNSAIEMLGRPESLDLIEAAEAQD
jgi:CRP/FNR family transcriptional regulator, cyclic AMP receptor protein